jgi:hypothetical protein
LKNETAALYGAAAMAAINTAEKFPGALSLGIVFAGVLIKAIKDDVSRPVHLRVRKVARQTLIVLLIFILTLFLAAPNLFIHFDLAKAGFMRSSRSTHVGADDLAFGGRLLFYIRAFASWSNLLVVFWIVAGCFALFKWRNHAALLFLYGAFYWVCLSVLSLHWERWALPMYLTPLLLSALGISFLWEQSQGRRKSRWALGILIGLFFFQQGISATRTSISLGYTDTRVQALSFAQSNGITPENSLFEGYTPFQERQSPKLIFLDYQTSVDDFEYILLSSGMSNRYYADPSRFSEEISIYESIRKNHRLLAKFEPDAPAQGLPSQAAEILNYFRRALKLNAVEFTRGPTIEVFLVVD